MSNFHTHMVLSVHTAIPRGFKQQKFLQTGCLSCCPTNSFQAPEVNQSLTDDNNS